jgi:hypothetical protein
MTEFVKFPLSEVMWQISEQELRAALDRLDEEAAPGIFDQLRGLTGDEFALAYERLTNPKWRSVERCRQDYNEAMGASK